MRMTQVIGLTILAKEMINPRVDPHYYKDASSEGMFDDGPMLMKYMLKNGAYAYEYVQACPWSSGPCIFIALASNDYVKDNVKPIPISASLWEQKEIDNV